MVIDFVRYWSTNSGLATSRFISWLKIGSNKFYNWRKRYGKANEHNGLIPRDFWLEDLEKQAIVDYHHLFPGEGYRRLTFMMLDHDIVAVSPSSTYRVLSAAGLLKKWNKKDFKKGKVSRNPCVRMNIGISTSAILISVAPSTTFVLSLTDVAAL